MDGTGPFLTAQQRADLLLRHKQERHARHAARLLAVLWRDEGVSCSEIARRLFLDEKTPRVWVQAFTEAGTEALLSDDYKPYVGKLDEAQLQQLERHVGSRIFLDVFPIIQYAQEQFGVAFSPSGMRDLLHRRGFVYKKASLVPGKADAEAQRRFVKRFQELMEVKEADTPVLFMDATHPAWNARPAYGWIRRGVRAEVPSTPGRHHLNISGAVNAETHETFVVEGDRVDGREVIRLLEQIERHYPDAPHIYVFADNARYNGCREVMEHLRGSRVRLEFLPPYSPNLNLIERVWKFMHRHTTYNRSHATFRDFREELLCFFHRLRDDFSGSLRSLLTLDFPIVPSGPRRQACAT